MDSQTRSDDSKFQEGNTLTRVGDYENNYIRNYGFLTMDPLGNRASV